MNIVIVSQHFAPEPCAPAARVLETARAWVDQGHRVQVVCAFPNHPTGVVPAAYRGRVYAREVVDGVVVHRAYVYAQPNEGFAGRVLCHASFAASALAVLATKVGPYDLLVATSPPLLPVVGAWMASRATRRPWVFEVRDLWPLIFKELGVMRDGPALRALEALELFLYGEASRVVIVSESFREPLIGRGVSPDKVALVTNGADLTTFAPGPADADARAELAGPDARLVALYLGTHGIAHALESHLRAAERLRGSGVALAFVGEGAEKARLEAVARERGLDHVRFLPPVAKARVAALYRAADVCFVPLRDVPLFEKFIPSKMFEVMACGRPLLGSVRGEARRILEESGAALVVAPEDDAALAEALLRLRDDAALRERLGAAGPGYVRAHYSREALSRRYAELLAEAAHP